MDREELNEVDKKKYDHYREEIDLFKIQRKPYINLISKGIDTDIAVEMVRHYGLQIRFSKFKIRLLFEEKDEWRDKKLNYLKKKFEGWK